MYVGVSQSRQKISSVLFSLCTELQAWQNLGLHLCTETIISDCNLSPSQVWLCKGATGLVKNRHIEIWCSQVSTIETVLWVISNLGFVG